MDIEDVHVPRILILINIWENYRFLNLVIFEKGEYIFYIECIICPAFEWRAYNFAECLYGYWRCACVKDFDFDLVKLQVVELSHFWEMTVHVLYTGYIICPAISSHNFQVLQNVGMDIQFEDMHMQRILIFFNFWKNYRLLNLVVFEEWEYIFYIGYISLYMCMNLWILNVQQF
jgi:hypothetical protein